MSGAGTAGGITAGIYQTSTPDQAAYIVRHSDAMLAVNRFVRPLPGARVLIMVTYHVGQALMAIGVLTVPVARVVTRS